MPTSRSWTAAARCCLLYAGLGNFSAAANANASRGVVVDSSASSYRHNRHMIPYVAPYSLLKCIIAGQTTAVH